MSELRELQGPEVSGPNETRAEFMRRLIKQANLRFTGHSVQAFGQTPSGQLFTETLPGVQDGFFRRIRFIALLPNSVFTAIDLNADQVQLPSSAKRPTNPRTNPNKTAGAPPASSAPVAPGGVDIVITDTLAGLENSVSHGIQGAGIDGPWWSSCCRRGHNG